MPKSTSSPRIETRLSPEDFERFQKLSQVKDLSISQLARDAITYYLDKVDADELDARESNLEKRIYRMENRMAGLIAMGNRDIGTMLSLVYSRMNPDTRDEHLKIARGQASKRMKQKISDELKDIKEDIADYLRKPDTK